MSMFTGVEVKPGMPFTLKATGETGVRRRLHISQVLKFFVDFQFTVIFSRFG